ncbi:MAG TPA: hypothetical protein VE573_20115 [Nitrososphaeraceae archaeon]|nr:hypothetical protein [Nitrososphaeraceae archaeon]
MTCKHQGYTFFVEVKLYNNSNQYGLVLKSIKPPALEEVRKLTLTDIAIMTGLADSFRDSFRKFVQIDPFTMPDPFTDKDDYDYLIIADKRQLNRIVALIAINKDLLPEVPWDDILGAHLVMLSISKQNAVELKYEMMPKDTNNFYPFRRSGRITGYIMFAFQICGLHQ